MALINLDDATPAPPANQANVRWQADENTAPRNISAYVLLVREIPTGAIDGSNATFTLANAPAIYSLHLSLNGVDLLKDTDFTIAADTITFVIPPQDGDWLLASYTY